jgi:cyclopropane-fatty-acyl-phospholipid synthase
MNAQAPVRGTELAAAGRSLGIGPQWFARVWSGGIERIIARLDGGVVRGSIEGVLPDGSRDSMPG